MDPMSLIGLLSQLGIGLAGEKKASDERAEASRLLREQAGLYDALQAPDLPSLSAEQLDPSAYDALRADPALRGAQMGSLDALQEVIDGGGYSNADQVQLNNLGSVLQRRAAQGRAAIDNDFAARGQTGGGASVAAKLAQNQQANEAQSQAGAQTAATGLGRRLEAIRMKGQQAGSIRGQDFSEGATKAGANDARARWNAASRQGAATYNAGLPAQNYQMQLQRLAGRGEANAALANNQNANAQATGQLYSGLGAAAGRLPRALKPRRDEDDDYGY